MALSGGGEEGAPRGGPRPTAPGPSRGGAGAAAARASPSAVPADALPTVRDPMQPITPAGLREEAAVSAARKRRTKTTERGRKGAGAFSGQRRAGPAGTGAGSWPGTSAGCPRRGGAGRGIPRVGSAAPIGCRPPRPGEAGPGRAGPGRAVRPRGAGAGRRRGPGRPEAGAARPLPPAGTAQVSGRRAVLPHWRATSRWGRGRRGASPEGEARGTGMLEMEAAARAGWRAAIRAGFPVTTLANLIQLKAAPLAAAADGSPGRGLASRSSRCRRAAEGDDGGSPARSAPAGDAAARSAPVCGCRLRRCPLPIPLRRGERSELSPVEDRLGPFPCLPAGVGGKEGSPGAGATSAPFAAQIRPLLMATGKVVLVHFSGTTGCAQFAPCLHRVGRCS